MSSSTSNYNLTKPAYDESADVAVINSNMDIIDTQMYKNAQGVSKLDESIAIVSNNNTHVAISAGQYVYVKGHSTLSEGLYTAKSAIAANAALSTSNLEAVSGGGLNALNSNIGNDIKFDRSEATTHNFTFPRQSANLIFVNGSGGSRQYVAYVYNSTDSLTIGEIFKGAGISISNNDSTLSLTFNQSMPCYVRVVNVSGSSNIT